MNVISRTIPKKDNFNEALLSISYLKQTEYAVKRFMLGHTKYTGHMCGWHNQFRYGFKGQQPPNYIVDKLLIKVR